MYIQINFLFPVLFNRIILKVLRTLYIERESIFSLQNLLLTNKEYTKQHVQVRLTDKQVNYTILCFQLEWNWSSGTLLPDCVVSRVHSKRTI